MRPKKWKSEQDMYESVKQSLAQHFPKREYLEY